MIAATLGELPYLTGRGPDSGVRRDLQRSHPAPSWKNSCTATPSTAPISAPTYSKSSLLLDFRRGVQCVLQLVGTAYVHCRAPWFQWARVRASSPVSTRPRRPCPPFFLRCKVSFQRDNGINHVALISITRRWNGVFCDRLQGIPW